MVGGVPATETTPAANERVTSRARSTRNGGSTRSPRPWSEERTSTRRSAGRPSRGYAEAWRAAQPQRPTTAKNVEQHLRRYAYDTLGDRPLAAIRPSEVQAWATALSPRLAPTTLHTVVNTIRAVFAAAVRDRVIAHNPCLGVALPRVRRRRVDPFTLDQVQTIIAATPKQYRALMDVAATTGLRSGEPFGLQDATPGARLPAVARAT